MPIIIGLCWVVLISAVAFLVMRLLFPGSIESVAILFVLAIFVVATLLGCACVEIRKRKLRHVIGDIFLYTTYYAVLGLGKFLIYASKLIARSRDYFTGKRKTRPLHLLRIE